MSRGQAKARKGSDGFTTVQRRSNASKVAWTCKSCEGRGGAPWRNDGSLGTCSKCKLAKGACFGAKVADACPTVKTGRAAAAPEVPRDYAALQAEVKRLRAAAGTANAAQLSAAAPCVTGVPADTARDEQQKAVEGELAKARELLRKLEHTPTEMLALLCKPHVQLMAEQKELVRNLEAKRRGLKPVDDQLKQVKTRLSNLQDKHAKEEKAASDTQLQITDLQAKAEGQRAKAVATAAEVEQTKVEYALLSQAATAAATGAAASTGSVVAPGSNVLTIDLSQVEGSGPLADAYNMLVNAPGAVRLTGAPNAAGNEAPLHAAPTQSLLQAAAYQQAQDLLGPGFWLEAASAAVDEDMVSVAESALEDLPTAEKEKALQERTAKAEGRRAEKAKKARVMATVLSQAFDKRRKKTGAVEGA